MIMFTGLLVMLYTSLVLSNPAYHEYKYSRGNAHITGAGLNSYTYGSKVEPYQYNGYNMPGSAGYSSRGAYANDYSSQHPSYQQYGTEWQRSSTGIGSYGNRYKAYGSPYGYNAMQDYGNQYELNGIHSSSEGGANPNGLNNRRANLYGNTETDINSSNKFDTETEFGADDDLGVSNMDTSVRSIGANQLFSRRRGHTQQFGINSRRYNKNSSLTDEEAAKQIRLELDTLQTPSRQHTYGENTSFESQLGYTQPTDGNPRRNLACA